MDPRLAFRDEKEPSHTMERAYALAKAQFGAPTEQQIAKIFVRLVYEPLHEAESAAPRRPLGVRSILPIGRQADAAHKPRRS